MSATRHSYSAETAFFGVAAPVELIKAFGSPLYVYNENILRARCRELREFIPNPAVTVCYSTKANANPHILSIIRQEGLHADAMSPGELALLRRAGFDKASSFYVCNNVAEEELQLAAREAAHVSVDSLDQLDVFGAVNPGGRVMVRVNPGIGAGHHKKVVTAGKETKFGVRPEEFPAMRKILAKHRLTLMGLNQHVGSLFMDSGPFLRAAAWLLQTAQAFPGIEVVDFGGGFGIPYRKYDKQRRLDLAQLGTKLAALIEKWVEKTGFSGRFFIEPGRYTVAECGLLLGRALAVKAGGPTRYVGTDLGFNVLARPMLYDAFHDVEVYPADQSPRGKLRQTIVGNICESGDILAKDRVLPRICRGDIIGVLDTGAYGHTMSSNYTQRLRPAEVLITAKGAPRLIRRRDTEQDLLAAYPERVSD